MNARRLILAAVASLGVLAGVLALSAAPVLAATSETPETGKATLVTATTATLNGVLNPNATVPVEPGEYEFVYGASSAECVEEAVAPHPDGMALGLEPEKVSVAVTGLQPGVTYTFCLRERNAAHETATGAPVTFTTPGEAPTIGEESVTEISSASARLIAQIDPDGADTMYRFEYASGTEYKPVPGGEGNAGSGATTLTISAQEQEGLQPATAYHFRVVVTNSIETVDGDAVYFTTQPLASVFALPDGRAWEMVSPPNKDGAEIENRHTREGGDLQASENGEAIAYLASAPIEPNPPGNPIETQVLSRRATDGGWISQDIATPSVNAAEGAKLGEIAEYKVFSPDLSLAYVNPGGLNGPPFIRNNETDTYTPTTLTVQEWYAQQAPPAPQACDASASPAGTGQPGPGVLGSSENGCYVYWQGPSGIEVSHYSGGQWETRLVAAAFDWSQLGAPHELDRLTARVAPNGQYVAFMSATSLTGYDNRDAISGEPDEEVYIYDYATDRLACASCNPTGARPVGIYDSGEGLNLFVDRSKAWKNHWIAGILPPWTPLNVDGEAVRQPRYLSNSGRLIFDSADGLVPQDVNGQMDVYEYEPDGVGSCGEAAGCVSLISSGTSDTESAFVDASASGDDIFFLTSSRLVPQDYDSYYDMYDAHVCSTSAPCSAQPPVSSPPCETSDSCKPAPSPQPTLFSPPASATFSGAGNVVPSVSAPPVILKSLTRAQKLKAALKSCAKKRKAKRRGCEAQARKKYSAKSKASAASSPSMISKRDNQGV
jgi:hypothetical protein